MVTTETETPVTGEIGIKDLLHAGLHFGHQTKRWNPKMKRYIFDKRNGIHIIDLAKSLVLLQNAMDFLYEVVLSGKSILFVGTKKQAQEIIKNTAEKLDMHYVTNRWLGGTLSNSVTIRRSVKRMKELDAIENSEAINDMPKKEVAVMRRELTKLRRNLSGIANMVEMPGAIVIIDINREAIAVNEARRLGIPIVAMVDTCCDPDPVDYIIPGNDDAMRAIKVVVEALSRSIEKGQSEYSKIVAERARIAEEERKKAEAKKAEAAPAPDAEETEKPAEKSKAKPKKTGKEKVAKTAKSKPAKVAEAGKESQPTEQPAAENEKIEPATEEKAESASEPELSAPDAEATAATTVSDEKQQ